VTGSKLCQEGFNRRLRGTRGELSRALLDARAYLFQPTPRAQPEANPQHWQRADSGDSVSICAPLSA
jgi:hypothetical protein